MSGSFSCLSPSIIALLLVHLGTLLTGKITKILEFRFAEHITALTELRLKR